MNVECTGRENSFLLFAVVLKLLSNSKLHHFSQCKFCNTLQVFVFDFTGSILDYMCLIIFLRLFAYSSHLSCNVTNLASQLIIPKQDIKINYIILGPVGRELSCEPFIWAFVSYVSHTCINGPVRVLCKPRLIFPHINGPNVTTCSWGLIKWMFRGELGTYCQQVKKKQK